MEGQHLILQLGSPTVVALDLLTGRQAWTAGNAWGPSYASPIPATIHGRRRVLVFAGGESQPPTGGLIVLDPANGRIDFAYPWRSRSYESVNAACPVVAGNRILLSASYRTGSVMLEIQSDFQPKVLWTNREFGLHFQTPVLHDEHIYGFDGRNEPDASLACLNAATGEVKWRTVLEWQERGRPMSYYRGSLLRTAGRFLALGELGHLAWLDLNPSGARELARTPLFLARERGPCPSSPAACYTSPNTRATSSPTPNPASSAIPCGPEDTDSLWPHSAEPSEMTKYYMSAGPPTAI